MTLEVLSLSQSLCLTYNRWVLDFLALDEEKSVFLFNQKSIAED